MHTNKRTAITLAVLALLAPLATGTVLLSSLRDDAQSALLTLLEDAQSAYRNRSGLSSLEARSQRTIEESQKALVDQGKLKRALRLRMVEVRTLLNQTYHAAAVGALEHGRAAQITEQQENALGEFLRSSYFHLVTENATGPQFARSLLQQLILSSLGTRIAGHLSDDAMNRVREDLIVQVLLRGEQSRISAQELQHFAVTLSGELANLKDRYESVASDYRQAQKDYDTASATVTVSEEELANVKALVAEIHDQVLKLQGELARIDARIRSKVERELIEKGLKAPEPGSHAFGAVAVHPGFSWPVIGPVAAHFHDAHYLEYFGIPHQGIDIVVPQGTPVTSATDGVVFLVKEGGLTGYTYVLIGHRGGYATLYGHLSRVAVSAGDDVAQGEVIGLSGGEPGSIGAGLMTTGSHLHFEVIERGENIDPESVLPQ
jgi:murein DD-endopeptidase MepM/ murein hydrolase activator NlpD